jgi:hypothetical protein
VFAERGYQKFALLHGTLTNDVEIIISVPSWGGHLRLAKGPRSEGPQFHGHACTRLPGCDAQATLGVGRPP